MNNVTYIGGLPFVTRLDADETLEAAGDVSRSSLGELVIELRSSLSEVRQLSYYFNEVSAQLLDLVGLTEAKRNVFVNDFGNALYALFRDNDFSWLRDKNGNGVIPKTITVCGLPYSVRTDKDRYLDAAGLLGEVNYRELELKAKSGAPCSLDWIVIHEMTHAILYEANYPENHNDDALVTPLGGLLYLLLRDNDFSWVRG